MFLVVPSRDALVTSSFLLLVTSSNAPVPVHCGQSYKNSRKCWTQSTNDKCLIVPYSTAQRESQGLWLC